MTKLLPKVFLSACLVKPTNHSQYPPYHGALFGINCHVTPWPPRASLREVESRSYCNSSAAAKYIEALSDIIVLGNDLLAHELPECKHEAVYRHIPHNFKVYRSCSGTRKKANVHLSFPVSFTNVHSSSKVNTTD